MTWVCVLGCGCASILVWLHRNHSIEPLNENKNSFFDNIKTENWLHQFLFLYKFFILPGILLNGYRTNGWQSLICTKKSNSNSNNNTITTKRRGSRCLTSLGSLDSNNCVTAHNWRQSPTPNELHEKKSISYLLRRVVSWNYFQTNFLRLAEFNRKKWNVLLKTLGCHPFSITSHHKHTHTHAHFGDRKIRETKKENA